MVRKRNKLQIDSGSEAKAAWVELAMRSRADESPRRRILGAPADDLTESAIDLPEGVGSLIVIEE